MVKSDIKITSMFPPTLDTRESATRLVQIIKDELANDSKLELDFQGVIFMSRSFADQFHKEITNSDIELDFVIKNANFGIIEMLDAVSKTQTTRKVINKSYSILSFNSLTQLKYYSFAW